MKLTIHLLAMAALCAAKTLAAPMGTAFTYQGRLNHGGAPANNIYDLTFTLHDDPVNVPSIGTFIILSAVPVTNGLFTVQLNTNGEFGPNAFNGQARWLQIGVRTNSNNVLNNFTFLSPRQPLTPAPAALFASNALQAVTASSANTATTAQTASVANSVAWPNVTSVPPGFADGTDNDTIYSPGAGLSLSAGNQFSVNFGGTGSANTGARSDHQHFGASWGGNASFGLGLSITNGAGNGAGLYGQQGTGSGFPYFFGNTAGVWGESSQGNGVWGASATSAGVRGVSLGANGYGVFGAALATNGTNYGVCGRSDSANGVGVLARGSGASGTALRISNGAIRVSGAGTNSATPAFVHVANLKTNFLNLSASVIDNPYCNDDPDAIVMLTPRNALFSSPMPASAFYDTGLYGFATNRWVIRGSRSEDTFNVLVLKP